MLYYHKSQQVILKKRTPGSILKGVTASYICAAEQLRLVPSLFMMQTYLLPADLHKGSCYGYRSVSEVLTGYPFSISTCNKRPGQTTWAIQAVSYILYLYVTPVKEASGYAGGWPEQQSECIL
jgi:hypothetical protein